MSATLRRLGALLLLVCAAFAASPARAQAKADAVDVRLGVFEGRTRFVVETSTPVEHRLFTLVDPYRIVIDFPELNWTTQPRSATVGVVAGFRYGLLEPGRTRVVLDLKTPVRVAQSFVIPSRDGRGARFVLDLESTDAASFAAMASQPQGGSPVARDPARDSKPVAAASPPAEPAPDLTAGIDPGKIPPPTVAASAFSAIPIPPLKPRPDFTVVIDAGHGGVDPGALGPGGIYEKNVTLAMARALRKELRRRGGVYRVVLTRDSDVYLRLRERVRRGRAAGADLFVSLHADSIESAKVRGASVYTLSETASDDEAAKLAAKENRADVIAGVALSDDDDVASILIDLAQRETMNQSKRFASILVQNLDGKALLLPRPNRAAGFAVLKAPDVPSVLIEMGYLSSPKDAALLTQAEHQERLAKAMADAVDVYFAARRGGASESP